MLHMLDKVLIQNGLVTSFALVGLIMWVSSVISRKLTFGRVHGSAIAIVIGLVLAYFGGVFTGGQKGLADLPLFTGVGLMGGAMLRDFAIVATAFEVQATEARKAGLIGVVSLLLGTVLPFIVGFSGHTTALVFYLAVGATGLVATLATRFEPRIPDEHGMSMPMAA